MEKSFEDLKYMFDANYPLIYLASPEYSRIIQKVRSISFRKGYEFNTWDLVDGLQEHKKKEGTNGLEKIKKHPNHEETENPDSLLTFLLKGNLKERANAKEIFLIEDAHKQFSDEKFVIQLRKISERFKAFDKHILLLSPFFKLPIELEKYVTVINMPLPDKIDLEKRLNVVLGKENSINEDLKKFLLDAAAGLTDTEADLAFRLAKEKVGLNKREAIKIVANEKSQIIRKSGILDYYQTSENLDSSVGGLDNLKQWLKLRSKAFERRAKDFGLKEPKGLLLLGVPGTGKSLTAKSIASEWNQPLLKLDIGKVFQAEVGSSESNIRQAIFTAEAIAPCVLWIDEIEKGLSTSGGEKDGGTNSRVFSTILTWMQEKTKPVFVVATANNISNLPPELLRKGRFDEIFFIDLPTQKERENIFNIHLTKNGQSGITNFEALSKKSKYFNGAEIEEVVKEAMFSAYIESNEDPKVKLSHLLSACAQIVPLAITMKIKIDGLREWALTRARPASADEEIEKIETEKEEKKDRKDLTKREREEDIF
jgi:SpoVK/Ycf46/Vps4 family AAA+-type ATPase